MNVKRSILAAGAAFALCGGAIMLRADVVSEPPEEETAELGATSSDGGHAANATGGYHFTIPAGIFPRGPIHNRVTFNAKRDDDGSVNGFFMYEQEVDGEVFRLGGPVTCFKVYDTPVLLPQFPDIPAQVQNRAKWGGRIEVTNDPSLLGVFAWFTSIDNGEGANGWSDISALVAIGNETANEAFCNSPNRPNRPFAIGGGNIQVH